MRKAVIALLLLLPLSVFGRNVAADSAWVVSHYIKKDVYIPMRDGVRLYTALYIPKDKKEKHPFLINRTPYSVAPYGNDTFRNMWAMHWMSYLRENYIIVLQDVRGKYMSEGQFVDVRPFNPDKKDKNDIDEASDTYDTIDWLLANVADNNGKVGVFGSSYPGFYTTMAALSAHPAIKAVSPQAPVTDWFVGDDFHHNGALMMMDAFSFYTGFGKPRHEPTRTGQAGYQYTVSDNYKFYLNNGCLANLAKLTGDSLQFWNDLYAHPNYDEWWQARNTRNWVQHIPDSMATLEVGGLFDAEDCFGAWNLFKAIDKKARNTNRIVMGPWAHGYWYRNDGWYLGNVRFGSGTSEWYQEHVEVPYFNYYLKGEGNLEALHKATIFFSGENQWHSFDEWPPIGEVNKSIYLQGNDLLSFKKPTETESSDYYVSDPAHPVPYTEDVHFKRTREYMTDDQRFASRRPDVLTYQTDVLKEDLTLAGPVVADLFTSISTTDADFVVKIIDVFPDDFKYDDAKDGKGNGNNYPMGGYEMLVRGEVMRGRYRNSFEKPEAFKPDEITEVKYRLPDVAHVFKKGHRLMVQIQSSWFPLVDRNPQQFVNIYTCSNADFVKSKIRIYHDEGHASRIILPVLKK
jgi:hypothetical protein